MFGERTLPIRREIPHPRQEFVASGEASRGVLRNSAPALRGGRGRRGGRGGWAETSLEKATPLALRGWGRKEDVEAEVDGWRRYSRKASRLLLLLLIEKRRDFFFF